MCVCVCFICRSRAKWDYLISLWGSKSKGPTEGPHASVRTQTRMCMHACLAYEKAPCGLNNGTNILSVSEAVRWDRDQSDVMGWDLPQLPAGPPEAHIQTQQHCTNSLSHTCTLHWSHRKCDYLGPKPTKHEYPIENMKKAARVQDCWLILQQAAVFQVLHIFKCDLKIFHHSGSNQKVNLIAKATQALQMSRNEEGNIKPLFSWLNHWKGFLTISLSML